MAASTPDHVCLEGQRLVVVDTLSHRPYALEPEYRELSELIGRLEEIVRESNCILLCHMRAKGGL